MARNPDLKFNYFSVKHLKECWDNREILINKEYQRSYIWTPFQKKNLIESIVKAAAIGVLVIWRNRNNQLEILDGQQRIQTIVDFLDNKFVNGNNKYYKDLDTTIQSEIEGYSIYYLELRSTLTEEEISDFFTRLQEGTPLNLAEKVNALRGVFRDIFMDAFTKNKIFFDKINNYRFKARLLAAQLLLLELDTNFNKNIFPNATYEDYKNIINKYPNNIPKNKIIDYNNYLNFLGFRLQSLLKTIPPRDLVSLYLLVSYLSKKAVDKAELAIYIKKFVIEFMRNLWSFSVYNPIKPNDMDTDLFKKYVKYKEIARQATTADSFEGRFKFIFSEYKRIFSKIKFKDRKRLFDEKQKIRIYYRQKCLCALCKKPLDFEEARCHHKDKYSKGGKTIISKGRMLHPTCHQKLTEKEK